MTIAPASLASDTYTTAWQCVLGYCAHDPVTLIRLSEVNRAFLGMARQTHAAHVDADRVTGRPSRFTSERLPTRGELWVQGIAPIEPAFHQTVAPKERKNQLLPLRASYGALAMAHPDSYSYLLQEQDAFVTSHLDALQAAASRRAGNSEWEAEPVLPPRHNRWLCPTYDEYTPGDNTAPGRYAGMWKHGLRHGFGTTWLPGNLQLEGRWEKDRLQSEEQIIDGERHQPPPKVQIVDAARGMLIETTWEKDATPGDKGLVWFLNARNQAHGQRSHRWHGYRFEGSLSALPPEKDDSGGRARIPRRGTLVCEALEPWWQRKVAQVSDGARPTRSVWHVEVVWQDNDFVPVQGAFPAAFPLPPHLQGRLLMQRTPVTPVTSALLAKTAAPVTSRERVEHWFSEPDPSSSAGCWYPSPQSVVGGSALLDAAHAGRLRAKASGIGAGAPSLTTAASEGPEISDGLDDVASLADGAPFDIEEVT